MASSVMASWDCPRLERGGRCSSGRDGLSVHRRAVVDASPVETGHTTTAVLIRTAVVVLYAARVRVVLLCACERIILGAYVYVEKSFLVTAASAWRARPVEREERNQQRCARGQRAEGVRGRKRAVGHDDCRTVTSKLFLGCYVTWPRNGEQTVT